MLRYKSRITRHFVSMFTFYQQIKRFNFFSLTHICLCTLLFFYTNLLTRPATFVMRICVRMAMCINLHFVSKSSKTGRQLKHKVCALSFTTFSNFDNQTRTKRRTSAKLSDGYEFRMKKKSNQTAKTANSYDVLSLTEGSAVVWEPFITAVWVGHRGNRRTAR